MEKLTNSNRMDCAFYNSPKRCKALNKKQCFGCAFFITAERLAKKRMLEAERIQGLPNFAKIKKKYYSVTVSEKTRTEMSIYD